MKRRARKLRRQYGHRERWTKEEIERIKADATAAQLLFGWPDRQEEKLNKRDAEDASLKIAHRAIQFAQTVERADELAMAIAYRNLLGALADYVTLTESVGCSGGLRRLDDFVLFERGLLGIRDEADVTELLTWVRECIDRAVARESGAKFEALGLNA